MDLINNPYEHVG